MRLKFWIAILLVLPLCGLLGMGGQSIPMGALPRALTYPQTDSISGLVLRWYLCGDSTGANCTASSSTVAYDSSGNGQTGTWGGTQSGSTNWYDAGVNDPWVGHFNGTDNYVVNNSVVNLPRASVVLWVYVPAYPVTVNGTLAGFKDGLLSGNADKYFYLEPTGHVCFFAYDGAAHTACSASSLPLNTWTHLVGTADGTNLTIYINSVNVASTACGPTYTAYSVPNVFVNSTMAVTVTYIADKVSDFRIYNRALSGAEISTIYAESNH